MKNRIANEIKARINGGYISIEMKADKENVYIEPNKDGSYYVFFGLNSQSATASSLEEVAEWVLSYPAKAIALANEDEAYVAEEMPKIKAYFSANFAGKEWNEIRSNASLYEKWGEYSDWHKEVFGYRPHAVVCGVYVRPY